MKNYSGVRTKDGVKVQVHDGDTVLDLSPRFDLRNHSPTGFEFGFCGSGPAQLALALLADALGNDALAQRYYQDFKFKVVANWAGKEFKIGQDQIQAIVADLQAKQRLPTEVK